MSKVISLRDYSGIKKYEESIDTMNKVDGAYIVTKGELRKQDCNPNKLHVFLSLLNLCEAFKILDKESTFGVEEVRADYDEGRIDLVVSNTFTLEKQMDRSSFSTLFDGADKVTFSRGTGEHLHSTIISFYVKGLYENK